VRHSRYSGSVTTHSIQKPFMNQSTMSMSARTMITLPILSPMTHAGAGAKKAQNDLLWPSWMPYAVACRLDESTWTSLLNMVPVPSHDAHHCPFDRAELPGIRLLSSGSPTVLTNAEGRQLPLHPNGASLGSCGFAAETLHSYRVSCVAILTGGQSPCQGREV